MNRIYNKGYIVLTLIFLLLSPILSLPFVLYGIYCRYKGAFLFLSIFLGLLAFLTGPTGDLYRHTLEYYAFKSLSYKQIILYLSTGDFTTYFLSYFFAQNDIPYPFMRLILTIIAYNILFYIFNYYVEHNTNYHTKKDIFFLFILLIMASDFFDRIYGVRFVMAVTISLLSYHCFITLNKRTLGIIIAFIAIYTHYTLLYYYILLILSTLIKVNKNAIWGLALVTFVVGNIGYSLLIMIASNFHLKYFGYLAESTWGTNEMEFQMARAGITRVVRYIYDRVSIILATMFILYECYDKKDFNCRFLYGVVLLFCAMNRFGTAGGRILYICEFFLICYILYNEFTLKHFISKNILNVVFVLIFFRFFIQLVGYGNIVRISSEYGKLFYPVTEVLQVDYDVQWMFRNVNADGSIKR